MRLLSFLPIICSCAMGATTHYIDSTATGTNDGSSRVNAWTSIQAEYASGSVAAGDTVNIRPLATPYSTTCSVSFPGQWFWAHEGTAGNIITFQVDPMYTGTVIMDGQNGSIMQDGWAYITVNGSLGDGVQRIIFQNYAEAAVAASTGWTSVHLTYLNFGSPTNALTNGDVIQLAVSNGGIEIDHCSVDQSLEENANAFIAVNSSSFSAAYDVDKVHDNSVVEPRDPTNNGYGAKAILWSASGVSIFNNILKCVPFSGSYSDAQHGDAFFDGPSGAISFIKFYNNRCIDFPNYSCYFDMGGNLSHALVYNNVASVSWAGGASQAFVSYGTSAGSVVNTDLQILNNTADNYASPYNVKNNSTYPTSDPSAFVNCVFTNNAEINTGGTGDQIDSAFTKATNSVLGSGTGTTNFSSYVSAGSLLNVYALKSGATLRAAGTPLASVTLDAANRPRPALPAIGAYEYYLSGLSSLAPGHGVIVGGP
jgi:hypothetical protein